MKLEEKTKDSSRFSINTDESSFCESEFKNFPKEISIWKARIFWGQKRNQEISMNCASCSDTMKKLENLNRIERISLMEKKITRNGMNE